MASCVFRVMVPILAVLVTAILTRPVNADPVAGPAADRQIAQALNEPRWQDDDDERDPPRRGSRRDSDRRGDVPGDFEFYVLALSWSPSWCEENGRRSREQCDAVRPYHFVVHGLWPQNERDWPESCRGPDTFVPRDVAEDVQSIMPSRPLIFHEWRKHGVCSGLSAKAYFDLVREAYEGIVIPQAYERLNDPLRVGPDQVEDEFVRANPGMSEDGVAVICRSNRLREVRICLTKDLKFRSCEQIDRRSCRAESVIMPPARGGR